MSLVATVVPPARFAQLPAGWHVSTNAPVVLVWSGADGSTLATNWPVRLDDPLGWYHQLRPGRVAIQILVIRRPPPGGSACSGPWPRSAHPLRLPLRLANATHATGEDSPLAEDRLAGRTGGYDVDLRVDYGVARPSVAIRRRVQRVLSAVRFPAWPRHC